MINLFYRNKVKILYFFLLFLFSVTINQYYGYIGVYPIDTFFHYDTGFRTLNGYFPTKDFWITTGFIVDFIQAFFFKIFGVTWFSYVLHASFFNFLIVISCFYTLCNFNLNIHFCFFYSFLISFIAYPTAGTPFVDFHSMIFSLIALFSFILSLKTKINIYWFFTPIFLGLAFLSKQTLAAYIGIILAISSIIYFIRYRDLRNLLYSFLGCLTFIFFFYILLVTNKIDIVSLYNQLILYPSSIGEDRFENFLFPLEFKRLILRFKLIHLSQGILIFIIAKKISRNINYFLSTEFLILFSIIISTFSFIVHQLLTLNQKFIFFIIPILLGLSHIYIKENFIKTKIPTYFLILLGLVSTIYYKSTYVDNRRFMELENINLNKSVEATLLNKSLKNLKWITPTYPNNPDKEINLINDSIKIINKENKNIMLLTHYQFIASVLNKNVHSPNRYHWKGNSYPYTNNKTFILFKNFFINQLTSNNVEVIYIIKPVDNNILKDFLPKDCLNEEVLNEILYRYLISNCVL